MSVRAPSLRYSGSEASVRESLNEQVRVSECDGRIECVNGHFIIADHDLLANETVFWMRDSNFEHFPANGSPSRLRKRQLDRLNALLMVAQKRPFYADRLAGLRLPLTSLEQLRQICRCRITPACIKPAGLGGGRFRCWIPRTIGDGGFVVGTTFWTWPR